MSLELTCFNEQGTYVLANSKLPHPTDGPRLPNCDRYSTRIHPTGGPAREGRPFGVAEGIERAVTDRGIFRHTRRLSRKHSAFSSTIILRIRSLGNCSKARVNTPGPTRDIVSPTGRQLRNFPPTRKCFNNDLVFCTRGDKCLSDLGRCLRITKTDMVFHELCTRCSWERRWTTILCCCRIPALGRN